MKNYHLRVLTIFIVLSGILVQYQNCGSKGGVTDAVVSEEIPQDDRRDVINEVNTGDIQFIQAKTTVNGSDSNLAVFGTCSLEHNKALLSWELLDVNGERLFSGQSMCSAGVFKVEFEGVDSLACGSSLALKAYFGAQAQTQTVINKKCI